MYVHWEGGVGRCSASAILVNVAIKYFCEDRVFTLWEGEGATGLGYNYPPVSILSATYSIPSVFQCSQ